MSVTFKFKEYTSGVFGVVKRPIAEVFFQHQKDKSWQGVTMLVDTGADYTLLPYFLAHPLGINLITDCKLIHTQGVGGTSKVYLLKKKIKVKLVKFKREIPIGFLSNDYIPPLLGRQEFFETFRVVFDKFHVQFEESSK